GCVCGVSVCVCVCVCVSTWKIGIPPWAFFSFKNPLIPLSFSCPSSYLCSRCACVTPGQTGAPDPPCHGPDLPTRLSASLPPSLAHPSLRNFPSLPFFLLSYLSLS